MAEIGAEPRLETVGACACITLAPQVYASRRGNWEVMLRGLFTNRTVRNLLSETIPPGNTIHAPTGELLPLVLNASGPRRERPGHEDSRLSAYRAG